MIAQQFSRLDPEEQRLLEVASVAGVEFAAAAIAAGADADLTEVEERCAAGCRFSGTREMTNGPMEPFRRGSVSDTD
jgi:hypothetical protein